MHRILMLSTAYRQSSRPDPTLRVSDPDNSLLSRFPMNRMDAESLRDSILRVSGRLDPRRFGPADEVETRPDGEVVTASARRSVYLLQRRSTPLTLLDVFDAPRMDPNCLMRRNSNVASQALQLWNSDLVRESSRHLAARIRSLAGNDIEKQVETLYLCALTRRPSPSELKTAGDSLRELKTRWSEHLPKGLPSDSHRADWLALATLCHVELNSAEFLFVP